MSDALSLKIITCSTRPGRIGPAIADWVAAQARENPALDVAQVDLADLALPLYDEPRHPRLRDYEHDHTKRWSAIVDEADAFVFVTPEYDFFPPASVVNALQYLLLEWNKKPAGVVSYGGVSGGLRAAQVLRGLIGNLGMVPMNKSFPIPFAMKQVEGGTFTPNAANEEGATLLLTDLADWAATLKPARG